MLDITMVLFRPRMEELAETLRSLSAVRSEFETLRLLLSGTAGEAAQARREVDTAGLREKTEFHHRYDNLGFATGHNMLAREAFAAGSDAVLILNPDVIILPGALRTLEVSASGLPQPCLVGPTLSRPLDAECNAQHFDSAGIAWTASGRHYDRLQGEAWAIQAGKAELVPGVTGACLYVTRAAFEAILGRTGQFFDDAFLAYREDAELGVRASRVAVRSYVVHLSGFTHVRAVRGFKRGNSIADLLGVRNRFLILWKLGRDRPGHKAVGLARDVLVAVGALVWERQSIPGLTEAFAIRRSMKYRRGLALAETPPGALGESR